MDKSSYFRFDDDNKTKCILSQWSHGKWVNWKHTAPYIVWWINEKICLILLTHSTKYIWEAFYNFNVFRSVCTMMTMRWCNVQTNEHDQHAKTYPTICTHHKLHNNNENKVPVRPAAVGFISQKTRIAGTLCHYVATLNELLYSSNKKLNLKCSLRDIHDILA